MHQLVDWLQFTAASGIVALRHTAVVALLQMAISLKKFGTKLQKELHLSDEALRRERARKAPAQKKVSALEKASALAKSKLDKVSDHAHKLAKQLLAHRARDVDAPW